jgi:hypothetical protein
MGQKSRRNRVEEARPSKRTINELIQTYTGSGTATEQSERWFGLDLLRSFLDGYAYESLGPADGRLFDRLFNLEGDAHREYCEIFGPEKIVAELRQFFEWFLIRKVMARPEDLREVAKQVGHFLAWLGERGHVASEMATDGTAMAEAAAGALVQAERATELLRKHLDTREAHVTGDLIEGYFGVVRMEPGKLWLESEFDFETYGPLKVPVRTTNLLALEWKLSGAVGKVGRGWALVEVWNVYPELGE